MRAKFGISGECRSLIGEVGDADGALLRSAGDRPVIRLACFVGMRTWPMRQSEGELGDPGPFGADRGIDSTRCTSPAPGSPSGKR
jgi:hypothetical protein